QGYQYEYRGRRVQLVQLTHDLEPGAVTGLDVEDDDVGPAEGRQHQAVAAVQRQLDGVPEAGEPIVKRLSQCRIALDDQDRAGHEDPLLRGVKSNDGAERGGYVNARLFG